MFQARICAGGLALLMLLAPFLPVTAFANEAAEEERASKIVTLEIGNGRAEITEGGSGRSVFLDAPPVIKKGRTFVPFRFVSEAFGATVAWDPRTQAVLIEHPLGEMRFTISSLFAKWNGVRVSLEAPPFIENGRTMVPLRVIVEGMGLNVKWFGSTQTIAITNTPPWLFREDWEGVPVVGSRHFVDLTISALDTLRENYPGPLKSLRWVSHIVEIPMDTSLEDPKAARTFGKGVRVPYGIGGLPRDQLLLIVTVNESSRQKGIKSTIRFTERAITTSEWSLKNRELVERAATLIHELYHAEQSAAGRRYDPAIEEPEAYAAEVPARSRLKHLLGPPREIMREEGDGYGPRVITITNPCEARHEVPHEFPPNILKEYGCDSEK